MRGQLLELLYAATETAAGGIQSRQTEVGPSYLGNANIQIFTLLRPPCVRLSGKGAKQRRRTAPEGHRSVGFRGEEFHRIGLRREPVPPNL